MDHRAIAQQTGKAESSPGPAQRSAWEAAAAQGIDMSLIEESLRKSPEERMREHAHALATVLALEAARDCTVPLSPKPRTREGSVVRGEIIP